VVKRVLGWFERIHQWQVRRAMNKEFQRMGYTYDVCDEVPWHCSICGANRAFKAIGFRKYPMGEDGSMEIVRYCMDKPECVHLAGYPGDERSRMRKS
jgi:hypothetical protein